MTHNKNHFIFFMGSVVSVWLTLTTLPLMANSTDMTMDKTVSATAHQDKQAEEAHQHDKEDKAHQHDKEDEAHQHNEHADEETHEVTIDDAMAAQQQIVTAKAVAGDIRVTTRLYGRLVVPPEQISEVRARFPGRITAVEVSAGDQVKRGQLLATIESSSSLQRYQVLAPIAGTITAKQANSGEIVFEQTLFTITNTESLWAELKVFPQQAMLIQPGQVVSLTNNNMTYNATIKQLVPSDGIAPYRIARVVIANEDEALYPGLLVEAKVVTKEQAAAIRIPNTAIQHYDDAPVAFVKTGENYQAIPLDLGLSDGVFTEVLSGLQQGDEIVVENSYLLKADLQKDGASHAH